MATKSTMNKVLRITILIGVSATFLFCMTGAAYIRYQNVRAVARAQRLARSIQELRVGNSDYRAARAIASDFGTVPYENCYGTRDCSDGYFERCAYMIDANDKWLRRLLWKYPTLPRLRFEDWDGTALIYIKDGVVEEYSFSIAYRSKKGQWRGFGAEEGEAIPAYRAVQAVIAGAYSVERNDIRMGTYARDLGFELESSLTPAATPDERTRAWHFEFGCLAQRDGCGEICEVMPDAWRDFYNVRGHFDVEKYGAAYLFCAKQ
jgi:hypothetical protein